MASASENRFDPSFAAQILLEIAHEQSLEALLQKLTERAMEGPHIVCVQVWLIEKGDLCATCARRPECPDQSRCLHLAVAKGRSSATAGKGFGRFDPGVAREPLGVPPIGSVVVSGEQRAVADLSQQPASRLDPGWMREENVRGYAINPISYKGEALGAIVTATREPFREELLPWGRLLAHQLGAAIANARAFEDIRVAGKRLEQANQRLAQELAERKRAEEELRTHREQLGELVKQRTEELAVLNQLIFGSLESGEVGAWWIDFQEPDTVHALDNTARMVGMEPDPTGHRAYPRSLWGKRLADTAAAFPEYAPLIEQAQERLAGAISGKYPDFRAVHPLATPDGSLKWIDGRGQIARRDEIGQALLMTGTIIDVTRLKQVEADLEEAKARAEAANREKSRFLANMSHELRTPLNAVLGFSRLLRSGADVTPHQQEVLDIIVRSGEHLLNLINNVLDMAKIESGRVALENSDVDLHQLLHEMQSLMGAGAAAKGLQFSLEPAPDLPRFVAVDAGKLRQVLLNLLGNAIKYTDSGGVKLRASLLGSAECRMQSAECGVQAEVRFEVEDSGPGISDEDCQRIFFPFVQLGGQAPAQAGTGLGLAICKQYVELMGGQIGASSEPGKGSVFYFNIPVTILPAVAEPDLPKHGRILGLAEGQPVYRLLIVEDQPENRLLLRGLLSPLGFELREAVNGQEALSQFEQWHPDLIWMDIRMPVMDGLEAVRRIRGSPAGSATRIIALTAHALEEEKRQVMAAGCDDFVRKPFREQEIFDALTRHLGLRFVYEKPAHPESTPEALGLALRPEQLDALPAELLRDLRQAVIELDTARTHALIEQVSARDGSLGRAMHTLATHLGYKHLLKLLKKRESR